MANNAEIIQNILQHKATKSKTVASKIAKKGKSTTKLVGKKYYWKVELYRWHNMIFESVWTGNKAELHKKILSEGFHYSKSYEDYTKSNPRDAYTYKIKKIETNKLHHIDD